MTRSRNRAVPLVYAGSWTLATGDDGVLQAQFGQPHMPSPRFPASQYEPQYKACNKDGAVVTTDSPDRPTTSKSGMPSWLKRVIMFAILGAVLVIVYFILAAFLPRWWAERIGELSDGGFARGIAWGLFFGGLCTLVPLLQLLLAVLFRHRRGGRVIAGIATLLALMFALPNLMTLSVVLGGNSAAHAGERIMDVEAPDSAARPWSGRLSRRWYSLGWSC